MRKNILDKYFYIHIYDVIEKLINRIIINEKNNYFNYYPHEVCFCF